MSPMRLEIWRGDWGLPSTDVNCLRVLAYAKFSEAPLEVMATSNPFRAPKGQLPVLRCDAQTLATPKDITAFLNARNYTTDFGLNSKQCAEVLAYDTMLKDKLYPALQFIWWVDQKNCTEIIRPWYGKAIPFPLSLYYPGKFERQAKAMVEALYPLEDISGIENEVYSEAQKCLTLLSTRLGESHYFFGSAPTSLDAIIYSYLAPLLQAPVPNAALQNHLKACGNLTQFVTRITQKYFPDDYTRYMKQKAEENAQKLRRDSDSEFPNKRRNQFLAGLCATLAMVSYALSTGIVQVPTKDDNNVDAMLEYSFDDPETEE
ncbi:metaxin-1 isoform X2 [Orussus abietinus]|uniref:metaxin-1 isoform X2 n=1 Tax=Orussus abietinus TaxID=222816 RepID=UPI000626DA32|nr:metaxin-1 isoform X2 [Orussus abietinus]